ncbi:metallophosphoesterase family protein [Candidatus Margulisiibacteriota bacterium]
MTKNKIEQKSKKQKSDKTIYTIGDIHGHYDKLKTLLSIIGKDQTAEYVFLGDYIDRGPQPKKVVELCIKFAETHKCIFLKGNHEELMENALSSIKKSETQTDDFLLWIINGGNTTCQSYKEINNIYKIHKDFFQSLKLYYETDDYVFVHAGLKPNVPLKKQKQEDLLWIRDNFIFNPFHYKDKTIIYGHTVTTLCKSPYSDKIGIDTGAGYGGQLTALKLPEMKYIQI